MADGVSSYIEISTNKSWAKVRVYYSQTYDISSNSSTVSIDSVQVYSTSQYGVTYWLDGLIKVNDITVVNCDSTKSTSSVRVNAQSTWYTVSNSSGSTSVNHNDDGTASIKISLHKNNYSAFTFFIVGDTSNRGFTVSDGTSQPVALTTIQRSASITNAENVVLGNACSVTWTPSSSSHRYKIQFSLDNWNVTTDLIYPGSTSSYTYTGCIIGLDVANQLPSATTGTMTAKLYTYSDSAGTTQIGAVSSRTFTVTIPESVVPTITSVTATTDNSNNSTVRTWGLPVAGYSKINLTAVASGSYGSTISSYTISGGYNISIVSADLSYTGDIISTSGIKTFTVVCTDSRGRTSVAVDSNQVVFFPYSNPTISEFVVARSSTDPSKITVRANWSYSSVADRNSASGTLFYKESTADEWEEYGAITQGSDITLSEPFPDTTSYNFLIEVTDALSNGAQKEAFISTSAVLLDFRAGGKGIGIGKVCESDAMEVSLDAKFYGAIYINGISLEDYIKSIINS